MIFEEIVNKEFRRTYLAISDHSLMCGALVPFEECQRFQMHWDWADKEEVSFGQLIEEEYRRGPS